MAGLGHVNLLVGANNSGKTSLLEALHLLTSRGHPRAIWQHLWRRGEKTIEHSPGQRPESPELDTSHLFAGHEFHVGSQFHLAAMSKSAERWLDVEVKELDVKQRNLFQTPSGSVPKLGLRIQWKTHSNGQFASTRNFRSDIGGCPRCNSTQNATFATQRRIASAIHHDLSDGW